MMMMMSQMPSGLIPVCSSYSQFVPACYFAHLPLIRTARRAHVPATRCHGICALPRLCAHLVCITHRARTWPCYRCRRAVIYPRACHIPLFSRCLHALRATHTRCTTRTFTARCATTTFARTCYRLPAPPCLPHTAPLRMMLPRAYPYLAHVVPRRCRLRCRRTWMGSRHVALPVDVPPHCLAAQHATLVVDLVALPATLPGLVGCGTPGITAHARYGYARLAPTFSLPRYPSPLCCRAAARSAGVSPVPLPHATSRLLPTAPTVHATCGAPHTRRMNTCLPTTFHLPTLTQ